MKPMVLCWSAALLLMQCLVSTADLRIEPIQPPSSDSSAQRTLEQDPDITNTTNTPPPMPNGRRNLLSWCDSTFYCNMAEVVAPIMMGATPCNVVLSGTLAPTQTLIWPLDITHTSYYLFSDCNGSFDSNLYLFNSTGDNILAQSLVYDLTESLLEFPCDADDCYDLPWCDSGGEAFRILLEPGTYYLLLQGHITNLAYFGPYVVECREYVVGEQLVYDLDFDSAEESEWRQKASTFSLSGLNGIGELLVGNFDNCPNGDSTSTCFKLEGSNGGSSVTRTFGLVHDDQTEKFFPLTASSTRLSIEIGVSEMTDPAFRCEVRYSAGLDGNSLDNWMTLISTASAGVFGGTFTPARERGQYDRKMMHQPWMGIQLRTANKPGLSGAGAKGFWTTVSTSTSTMSGDCCGGVHKWPDGQNPRGPYGTCYFDHLKIYQTPTLSPVQPAPTASPSRKPTGAPATPSTTILTQIGLALDLTSAELPNWSASALPHPADAGIYADCPNNPNECFRLSQEGYATKTFSTIGYRNIQMRIDITAHAISHPDRCTVEYTTAAIPDWVTLIYTLDGGIGIEADFPNKASINDRADLTIRLSVDSTESATRCYFDSLELWGATALVTTAFPTSFPTTPTAPPSQAPTALADMTCFTNLNLDTAEKGNWFTQNVRAGVFALCPNGVAYECFKMDNQGLAVKTFSTLGFRTIRLRIDISVFDMIGPDRCIVEYTTSPDIYTATYTELISTLVGGTNMDADFPDDARINDRDDVTIRIRTDFTSANKATASCYWDALRLFGVSILPSATTELTAATTTNPTSLPSDGPTDAPTNDPTSAPSVNPTSDPTISPSDDPSAAPTNNPSTAPTLLPTNSPSDLPSSGPTFTPTETPTNGPTAMPSSAPTVTVYNIHAENSADAVEISGAYIGAERTTYEVDVTIDVSAEYHFGCAVDVSASTWLSASQDSFSCVIFIRDQSDGSIVEGGASSIEAIYLSAGNYVVLLNGDEGVTGIFTVSVSEAHRDSHSSVGGTAKTWAFEWWQIALFAVLVCCITVFLGWLFLRFGPRRRGADVKIDLDLAAAIGPRHRRRPASAKSTGSRDADVEMATVDSESADSDASDSSDSEEGDVKGIKYRSKAKANKTKAPMERCAECSAKGAEVDGEWTGDQWFCAECCAPYEEKRTQRKRKKKDERKTAVCADCGKKAAGKYDTADNKAFFCDACWASY